MRISFGHRWMQSPITPVICYVLLLFHTRSAENFNIPGFDWSRKTDATRLARYLACQKARRHNRLSCCWERGVLFLSDQPRCHPVYYRWFSESIFVPPYRSLLSLLCNRLLSPWNVAAYSSLASLQCLRSVSRALLSLRWLKIPL